jgi:hypothetical protein
MNDALHQAVNDAADAMRVGYQDFMTWYRAAIISSKEWEAANPPVPIDSRAYSAQLAQLSRGNDHARLWLLNYNQGHNPTGLAPYDAISEFYIRNTAYGVLCNQWRTALAAVKAAGEDVK